MARTKRNKLSQEEREHFFGLLRPLLAYADLDTPLVPADTDDLNRRSAIVWEDTFIIESCIYATNHKKIETQITFSEEECAILRSWKQSKLDSYYLVAHQHYGSLLLNSQFQLYRVVGPNDSLEDLFPETPVILTTILLPWKDVVVSNGLYTCSLLPEDKSDLLERALDVICSRIIRNDGVITSLGPVP